MMISRVLWHLIHHVQYLSDDIILYLIRLFLFTHSLLYKRNKKHGGYFLTSRYKKCFEKDVKYKNLRLNLLEYK